MTVAASAIPADETILKAWDSRIHVLNNPSAWSGVSICFDAGAFFLGLFFLGLLFLFISKSMTGLLVALGIFCGLMVLFVLIGGAIDLFGGFRGTFIISDRGVRSIDGREAKAASEAVVVRGILTGIAAGVSARAEQNVFIPYSEISRVDVNENRRNILIKGSWLQKPIALSCTPENFNNVQKVLT